MTPTITHALILMIANQPLAETLTDLENHGWQMETLHPGVTRCRHVQVDVADGTVSVERAVEITNLLTGELKWKHR